MCVQRHDMDGCAKRRAPDGWHHRHLGSPTLVGIAGMASPLPHPTHPCVREGHTVGGWGCHPPPADPMFRRPGAGALVIPHSPLPPPAAMLRRIAYSNYGPRSNVAYAILRSIKAVRRICHGRQSLLGDPDLAHFMVMGASSVMDTGKRGPCDGGKHGRCNLYFRLGCVE